MLNSLAAGLHENWYSNFGKKCHETPDFLKSGLVCYSGKALLKHHCVRGGCVKPCVINEKVLRIMNKENLAVSTLSTHLYKLKMMIAKRDRREAANSLKFRLALYDGNGISKYLA